MSALSSLIALACGGMQGDYSAACDHALTAGAEQTEIRQNADVIEKRVMNTGLTEIGYVITTDGVNVIGGALFVAKTVKDRNIAFGLPTMGVCDQLSNEITTTSYTINFRWNF